MGNDAWTAIAFTTFFITGWIVGFAMGRYR